MRKINFQATEQKVCFQKKNEKEDHDFQKIGDLLSDAVERLFERVKQRKIEEFMEQIKNGKQNGEHKRI